MRHWITALSFAAALGAASPAYAQQWVSDDPRVRFGFDGGIGVAAFTDGIGEVGGRSPCRGGSGFSSTSCSASTR